MATAIGRIDATRAFKLFADWTDRIAAGELPASQPPRPQGVERNVVITLWDWAGPKSLSPRRDRHRQAQSHRQRQWPALWRTRGEHGFRADPGSGAPHEGRGEDAGSRSEDSVLEEQSDGAVAVLGRARHLGQPDQRAQSDVRREGSGLVHLEGRARRTIPAFCKKGSDHPSAKLFPLEQSNRHLSMYDPKTGKFTLISTCFPTHHLQFAEDANQTLWTSAGGPGERRGGLAQRKMFEETGDEKKSQGWTALILDTNGNGKRDDYVEPESTGRSHQGQADRRGFLRRRSESRRRLHLGVGARLPRCDRSAESRRKPARHRPGGNLRAALPRLFPARDGHRS